VPAITDCLGRLLQDQTLRERLIDAGIARAASFTWDAAAKGTLEELEAAVVR
jgi:glycosyltransferase involved in cell wall biosynthesis